MARYFLFMVFFWPKNHAAYNILKLPVFPFNDLFQLPLGYEGYPVYVGPPPI